MCTLYSGNFSSREFGAKVINLKTLMKALPSLFEHSDKNVRAEVLHECVYSCLVFLDVMNHVCAGQGSSSGALSLGWCRDKTHS